MRLSLIVFASLALTGCKKNDPPQGQVKPADPVPLRCPAGNVVKDGTCVQVITAERLQAVVQQSTRLDELALLLGRAEVVAAPIELLNGVRQLDTWKTLAAASSSLGSVDQILASLGEAVAELRSFKESLGTIAGRLNNLSGELDTLMKESAATRTIEDVRTQVSARVQSIVTPLQQQVQATMGKVTGPLAEKLGDLGDLVTGACAVAKSGGSAQLKSLCAQAKDVFGKAVAYLLEVKDKPLALLENVTGQLQSQLGELVDTQTRGLLESVQTEVRSALALPATAAASPAKPVATAAANPGKPATAVAANPGKPAVSQDLLSALGQPCSADGKCVSGSTCTTYYGIAGPAGPAFTSCEVPCNTGNQDCPAGTRCVTVADGPGAVCRP
jgi:hypothetical protein